MSPPPKTKAVTRVETKGKCCIRTTESSLRAQPLNQHGSGRKGTSWHKTDFVPCNWHRWSCCNNDPTRCSQLGDDGDGEYSAGWVCGISSPAGALCRTWPSVCVQVQIARSFKVQWLTDRWMTDRERVWNGCEVKQGSGPTEWQEAHCQVIEAIKVEEGGGRLRIEPVINEQEEAADVMKCYSGSAVALCSLI